MRSGSFSSGSESKTSMSESGFNLQNTSVRRESQGGRRESGASAMAVRSERKGSRGDTTFGLSIAAKGTELKVGRKTSMAVRVKVGKVREMVNRFNAAALQEEPANEIDATPKIARFDDKVEVIESKIGEMENQDNMGAKVDGTPSPTAAITKVDETPIQDEERKNIEENSLQEDTNTAWEVRVTPVPKDDDSASVHSSNYSDFDEIFGSYDRTITRSTSQPLEHNTVSLQLDPPLIQETVTYTTDSTLDQDKVATIIAGIQKDLNIKETLFSTVAQVDTATQLNESQTPVQEDFNIKPLRIPSLERQYSNIVDTTTELNEASFQDDTLSFLVGQYSDLVSPITDFDDSTAVDDNQKCLSATSSSREPSLQDRISHSRQHLSHLDSPSTTPILRQSPALRRSPAYSDLKGTLFPASSKYSDDNISPLLFPGGHRSKPCPPSSCYSNNATSLNDNQTPPLRFHNNTQRKSNASYASSHYSTNSRFDPKDSIPRPRYHNYPPSTQRLSSSDPLSSSPTTTSPPTLTSQTSSSTSNSSDPPQKPATNTVGFDDNFASESVHVATRTSSYTPFNFIPQSYSSPYLGNDLADEGGEEEEREDGVVKGGESLIRGYVPVDGTVWNWDGTRWVGQHPDNNFF